MTIDKKHIEKYLAEVKASVADNKYRIDRNDKRQDNNQLFIDYVINEADANQKERNHERGETKGLLYRMQKGN